MKALFTLFIGIFLLNGVGDTFAARDEDMVNRAESQLEKIRALLAQKQAKAPSASGSNAVKSPATKANAPAAKADPKDLSNSK